MRVALRFAARRPQWRSGGAPDFVIEPAEFEHWEGQDRADTEQRAEAEQT
ncbi:MAG: hypothetical protein U1E97_09460 [Alphaproteobacteria bacterium]